MKTLFVNGRVAMGKSKLPAPDLAVLLRDSLPDFDDYYAIDMATGEATKHGDMSTYTVTITDEMKALPVMAELTTAADTRDLSPAKFRYLLGISKLAKVWDNLKDVLEAAEAPEDTHLYGLLLANEVRKSYRLSQTLELIAAFSAHIPEGVDVSEPTIRAAWKLALYANI